MKTLNRNRRINLEYIQYADMKQILNLFSFLNGRAVDSLSEVLGKLWLKTDKRHADIALNNLKLAYGNKLSDTEVLKLREKHFIQFARLLFDIPKILRINLSNIRKYTDFENEYHLRKALRQDRPVILFTAHMGNWELMSACIGLMFSCSLNVVARPLDFVPLGRLANELRESTGNKVIDKFEAGSVIRKILVSGGIAGILIDQKASGNQAVDVPFFGVPALTNKVAALLALRYDAIVIPVFNYRIPDGRYRIVFDRPVKLSRSGNSAIDIIDNTVRFNLIIEKFVRKAPENWFWTH
jgi:KDO2-lipid IV(A) lauroyltransferase